jgi:hypothetical protein
MSSYIEKNIETMGKRIIQMTLEQETPNISHVRRIHALTRVTQPSGVKVGIVDLYKLLTF